MMDSVGHYSLPDLLQLRLNSQPWDSFATEPRVMPGQRTTPEEGQTASANSMVKNNAHTVLEEVEAQTNEQTTANHGASILRTSAD
jgi:hypothetical protein